MEQNRRRGWVLALVALVVILTGFVIFSSDKMLTDFSKWEVYAMAVPATLMPVCYTVFFHWWESPLGRALFIKGMGLLLLIDLGVAANIWGEKIFGSQIEEIAFVVYSLVLVGLSYQLIVMTKIWWAARHERASERYENFARSNDTGTPVPDTIL